MTKANVDSIGQGRVWSGTDAKKIGLIDEFGGLTQAVNVAAEMAKLKSYRLMSLPEQKDPYQQIIDEIFGNSPESRIQNLLGEDFKYYKVIKDLREMKGIQARMLYEFDVN
jgi:protease-4